METLKENNKVVQIYLVDEMKDVLTDPDALAEWNKYISELRIEGQKRYTDSKSPIPFLPMNRGMRHIFATLCKTQENYKDFTFQPIPLAVLKIISLAEREHYFNNIIIRYDDYDPDPVVIGEVGHWQEGQYYSDSNADLKEHKFNSKQEVIEAGGHRPTFYEDSDFLMARWGAEAKSMVELKKLAMERYREDETLRLTKTIKSYQNDLDDIDTRVKEYFN